jgi:DNA-binding MurR/RpiR family transcriptional regulator
MKRAARSNDMLDLVGHLRLEKENFSRSERLLIDTILADVDAALNSSIVDLARAAEVSPPP